MGCRTVHVGGKSSSETDLSTHRKKKSNNNFYGTEQVDIRRGRAGRFDKIYNKPALPIAFTCRQADTEGDGNGDRRRPRQCRR